MIISKEKTSTKKRLRQLKIGIERQNINVTYQLQSTMIFGNKDSKAILSGNWWGWLFLLFQANHLLNFKLECYNEGNNSRLIVFNFIGGGLYGLSITNVSGDVCTDGSCSIFVLLDHPISRKTWVESQQRKSH